MGHKKHKPPYIEFRPPCEGVNGSSFKVKDEVLAEGVFVHVERMSDEAIWMGLTIDGKGYGFDFVVGQEPITNEEGEKVFPLNLTAWEY